MEKRTGVAKNAPETEADEKAEKIALGILLHRYEGNISEALELLKPRDFYSAANQIIYTAIQELHADSIKIEHGVILSYLKKKNLLDGLGDYEHRGRKYILKLNLEEKSAPENYGYYAEVIKRYSVRRDLLTIGSKFERGLKGGVSAFEIAETIKTDLTNLGDESGDKAIIEQLKACKKDTIANIVSDHKKTFETGGVRLGFPQLDNYVSFLPGTLNIIQAPTGQGKTAFMLNLFCHFLNKNYNPDGVTCVFVTYETSALVVKERALNTLAYFSHCPLVFRRRYIQQDDLYQKDNRYFDYFPRDDISAIWNGFINEGNIRILENVHFENLPQVIKFCKSKKQPLVLFLDYIQKIDHCFQGAGWENIKKIAYGLEKLAVSNKIVIIAGSQVTVKENFILDAREGRDIENAASNIISLVMRSHPRYKENSAIYIPRDDNGNETVGLQILKARTGVLANWPNYLLLKKGVFWESEKHQKKT